MKPYSERYTSNWRQIILLIILGGIAGFFLARILPERYTATAFLSVSIDHNQTGALTDLEEDRMIGVMEDIIKSTPVIAKVCQDGSVCTNEEFLERISLNRTNDRWYLTVSGNDPDETAASVSNWYDEAYSALTQSSVHATEARFFERSLDNLSTCVAHIGDQSILSNCPADAAESFAMIEETSQRYHASLSLSNGLSPAIVMGLKQNGPADIRMERSSSSQGLLTLLGALIGFLVSLLICFLAPIPEIIPSAKEKSAV